ncbi:hypothetical protein HDU67_004664, partial [Dinochytrium kinnereticum]
MGGHALGGGFGLLSRQLGLMVDTVVEMVVVNAKGDILVVNDQTDAELFWALRGAGGGNFGIVTSFKVKIFKAPPKLAIIQIQWSNPVDRNAVIKAFSSIAPTLPNEITSTIYTSAAGALSFTAARYGPKEGFLEGTLKQLFLNALPQTYTVLMNEEVVGYVGMIQKIWNIPDASILLDRSKLLTNSRFKATSLLSTIPLSDEGIKTLVDDGPLVQRPELQWDVSLMLDSWGGKIAEVDPSATSFMHRFKTMVGYQLYTSWESTDAMTAQDRKRMIQDWRVSMQPHVLSSAYQNYIDSMVTLEAYYGVDGLKRLVDVKCRVDPFNVWKFSQGVNCPNPPYRPYSSLNTSEGIQSDAQT